MASKTRTQTATKPATRTAQVRQSITLELALALCPQSGLAENLSRTFGLDPVDTAGIREATEEHLALASKEPCRSLTRPSRCTCSGSSAPTSAPPTGPASSTPPRSPRPATSTMKVANEDRDEDRDGVSGFESRAERARIFAGEMGLQAHALLAAAEGAVSAYAHLIGNEWKPYEAPSQAPTTSAAPAQPPRWAPSKAETTVGASAPASTLPSETGVAHSGTQSRVGCDALAGLSVISGRARTLPHHPPSVCAPPQAGGCRVGGRFAAGSYQPFQFAHIPVDKPYIELLIGRFWRGVLTSGTTTAFIWNLTAVLCAMPLRAQKKSPTQRTYRIGHGGARVRPRPSQNRAHPFGTATLLP